MGCLLALAACSDLPALQYETDELMLGTSFPEPVCEGTLRELDHHTRTVRQMLEVEPPRPSVYWFDNYDEVEELCGDDRAGCYLEGREIVIATESSLRHEINHGLALEWGNADALVNEGIAVAFTGYRTQFLNQAPVDMVGLDPEDLSYPQAGHFIRFLYETRGIDPLREVARQSNHLRGTEQTRKAFADAYGESLADLDQEFHAEAPEAYPVRDWCDLEPLPLEGETVRFATELDCAAEHTQGRAGTRISRSFRLELPPDTYELEVEGATVHLTECLEHAVPVGEPVYESLGADPGGFIPGPEFPAGQIHRFSHYDGNALRVDFEVEDAETATVQLSIRPQAGGYGWP